MGYQGQPGSLCDQPGGLPGCPCGADPSDLGMSFSFRLRLLFLLLANQIAILIYGGFFSGPIRTWMRKKSKKKHICLIL
eukprot:TRINITY_DN342_c2_g1_i1.p1 TRINITY_DN342_c2_g1~~TRINITY_DN342_c2_g1_i1.p1  ORF type:complete len:92 (-),score=29.01 TRINITY_DN342_c2_g1_i1:118-354(-)